MLNVDAVTKSGSAEGKADLEASLAAHVERINELLDPHEQLDCIVLTTTAWTVDNDLITPTFKVKRNKIEDLYAARYEEWVASRRKVIWFAG
jgi:long-chain acyl-CoA synthetase